MNERPPVNAVRGTPWRPILIVACGALLFGWRLGSHDLWPPDEPRFGLVAREMLERRDFTVLSLNDHLYTDKPPLFFWAIDACALLRGGVDEWAARLPSAAAAVLALLVLYRLGAWLDSERTGLLAAGVFATAPQIVQSGRWAQIDMTLGLCVLGAIALLARARMGPTGGRAPILGAWAMMGLATLAKGPVGLLLPLLVIVPAALLEGDGRGLRRLVPPAGVVLYLLVVLSWFVPFARRLGLGTALGIATHQTVERYLDAWNGRHPVWYFLWEFPLDFAPWSLFLPAAGAFALSERERPRRRVALFLMVWFAAVFLFFSFSTGKRGVYLIPLYPAASLLVARLFARGGPDRLRSPVVAWAGLAAVLAAGLPFAVRRTYPDLAPAAAGVGALLLGGAVAALLLRRRRPAASAWAIAGSMSAAILLIVSVVQPWAERRQNLGGFAAEVRARLEPGVPFGTTEQKREAWVFYTGRFAAELDTEESLVAWMGRPGPRDLLVEEAVLRRVRERLPAGIEIRLRGRVAGQDYYLLRRAGA
jgi:4-amino-4-deoxy-L-arabinose transferase-like glycosyltransferase